MLHQCNGYSGWVYPEDDFTTAELARVLAIQPKFIVKPKQLGYIKEDSPSGLLLANVLTTQYQLVGEIQGREIHRIILFP